MKTEKVMVGTLAIGGGAPVSVQSMTNTKTKDVVSTVSLIHRLEAAGCELVRVAVPDEESALCIDRIKEQISVPLVADIHFDYRLALLCIERGIDKIRINPGNIGSKERVEAVAQAAKQKGIPIRIGVNGGSLEPALIVKYGRPCPEAMVESAFSHIKLLEQCGFDDIVISLKASDVADTVAAYRLMAERCTYPLHLGVTEAGTRFSGTVKSSVGIGALLLDGIGDTIRVSLTADPVEEVTTAIEILKACGLRNEGVRIVSCPTCARCNIDMIPIAEQMGELLKNCKKNIKVAIMGCAVNGPGEARDADIGIAGGRGEALLFKKGKSIRKVPEADIVRELMAEIERL